MKLLSKPKPVSGRQRPTRYGSIRPSTNSYYSSRKQQESNVGRKQEAPKPKRSKNSFANLLHKSGIVLFLIILTISLVYGMSLSSKAKVIVLNSANSNFLRDINTYQDAASKLLAGSIWNKNKLTINTNAITDKLVIQFPELNSVSMTIPILAHRPIIYISPAQPALILVNPSGSYVLDNNGRALMSVSDPKQLVKYNIPLVTDNSGFRLVTNQQVLSSSDVTFIRTIVAELAAKQVVVSSLTLPPATREVDAGITSLSYIVKFNLQDNNSIRQAGTYLAAKAKLAIQGITPGKYIDVRVPGRAYYQ
jgi:hypothetical protein